MKKLDQRFHRHVLWFIAAIVVLAMTGIVAGAMGMALQAPVVFVVLAGLTVVLALSGVAYSIWMHRFAYSLLHEALRSLEASKAAPAKSE